ncbi:hypothetical protein [Oscillatoria sp. FACHB-1406]|uniref:hypothetical protein n=1 Tax=Oscillatoria sp. FACHB-1406 TaxID=2692846 RepID=UPI00168670D5|nr:hypothetical protein [Oscillatoria sp. FACHB-1406]MBD2577695.1 hypothetical protein [Oscillatoria sp. FACHB-1406]
MFIDRDRFQHPTDELEERCIEGMGEQQLQKWAKKNKIAEAYRFIYIPSFDPPEILRVSSAPSRDPALEAVFKLGSREGKGDTPTPVERHVSWEPESQDWTKLLTSLEQNFWKPGTWKQEGSGGSEWLFEGYRAGEYKRLRSWYGRNPLACTLGRSFRHFIPEALSQQFVYFRSLVGDRFGEIIYEYLEAGQPLQALKLAQSHKADYIKTWLFEGGKVFDTWSDLDLPAKLLLLAEAVATAQTIDNRLSKAPILRDIALKYIAIGQLNRALYLTRNIVVPYYRIVTLDYLCDCFAAAERTEDAAQIRMEILLTERSIQGDPEVQHLTKILLKHRQIERFDRKLSRWFQFWRLPPKSSS